MSDIPKNIPSDVTVRICQIYGVDNSIRERIYVGSDGWCFHEIYDINGILRIEYGNKAYKEIYLLDKGITDICN